MGMTAASRGELVGALRRERLAGDLKVPACGFCAGGDVSGLEGLH